MENILTVKNLCKDNILKDISFQVKKGEMAAIMGPSGSGKSTLLYQVSGMDSASFGEVLLGGTDISKMKEDDKAKLRLTRMGFVFQQMNVLKNLNLRDNILLPAYQRNHTRKGKAEADRRARALMEKMKIEELGDRKVTEVSGGQLQRACICRSMMNNPEILFADEPTGALNQSAAGEVMEELARINREGTTILMVTHDSKVAAKCERIIYILDGRIRGELVLGKWDPESSAKENRQLENPMEERAQDWENAREEKIGAWLKELGW